MKKIILIILIIVSLALAQKPISIAISDFEINTGMAGHAKLKNTIPEMLKTELAQYPELLVVERSKISSVMREQALGQTGIIKEGEEKQVGELVGAEFVLTGELSKVGGRYRIDTHITHVQTGKVYAEMVNGPYIQELEAMMQVLGNNIYHNLTTNGSRVEEKVLHNYRSKWVIGAGVGTTIIAGLYHLNYNKHYNSYKDATMLDDFDSYYNKANSAYKTRNYFLLTSAVLYTVGVPLWFNEKINDNKVFATDNNSFSVLPYFSYNQVGLHITF